MILKQSETIELYGLLKKFTEILEKAQSRQPDDFQGQQNWERLGEIIIAADRLYCDIADLDT